MSVGYWSTPIGKPDIRSTCNQLERVYVRQQQAVVKSWVDSENHVKDGNQVKLSINENHIKDGNQVKI